MIYWWVLIFLFFSPLSSNPVFSNQLPSTNSWQPLRGALPIFFSQLNTLSYWFWSYVFNCWIVANLLKPVCLPSGTILTKHFFQLIFNLICFLSSIKISKFISDYIKAERNDSSFQSLKWKEDNSDSSHMCILEPMDQRLSSPYNNTDISTYLLLVLICQ